MNSRNLKELLITIYVRDFGLTEAQAKGYIDSQALPEVLSHTARQWWVKDLNNKAPEAYFIRYIIQDLDKKGEIDWDNVQKEYDRYLNNPYQR